MRNDRPPAADLAPAVTDGSQYLPESPTPEQDGSPILTDGPVGLTPSQKLAIAALVCGRTLSSAAIQAGVDRRTLYEWRKLPAFRDAVQQLSQEALEASATRARNLMLKATRTLGEALCGRDRFDWAMRIANSRRVWDVGQILPKFEDEADLNTSTPTADHRADR